MTVTRVGVVVPARNEERLLTPCLTALAVAAQGCPVAVDVVVVLDRCWDASAAMVARFVAARADVRVRSVEVSEGNVGAARRYGMALLLRDDDNVDRTWLASTDADSEVPLTWFDSMIAHAETGADLVAGTVVVTDWRGRSEAVRRRAIVNYANGPHRHIHGANLSFSAQSYIDVGGFPGLAAHEDVALVNAFKREGKRICWATDMAVTTSARRSSRAPAGFAAYLTQLETEVAT